MSANPNYNLIEKFHYLENFSVDDLSSTVSTIEYILNMTTFEERIVSDKEVDAFLGFVSKLLTIDEKEFAKVDQHFIVNIRDICYTFSGMEKRKSKDFEGLLLMDELMYRLSFKYIRIKNFHRKLAGITVLNDVLERYKQKETVLYYIINKLKDNNFIEEILNDPHTEIIKKSSDIIIQLYNNYQLSDDEIISIAEISGKGDYDLKIEGYNILLNLMKTKTLTYSVYEFIFKTAKKNLDFKNINQTELTLFQTIISIISKTTKNSDYTESFAEILTAMAINQEKITVKELSSVKMLFEQFNSASTEDELNGLFFSAYAETKKHICENDNDLQAINLMKELMNYDKTKKTKTENTACHILCLQQAYENKEFIDMAEKNLELYNKKREEILQSGKENNKIFINGFNDNVNIYHRIKLFKDIIIPLYPKYDFYPTLSKFFKINKYKENKDNVIDGSKDSQEYKEKLIDNFSKFINNLLLIVLIPNNPSK